MTTLSPTPRSTLTRKRDRARDDRQALYDVLDAGLVCHLGLVLDGSPVVLPTGYGRDGDTLYLHGSTGSGNLREAARGVAVCVTVTLVDGIVYSRSVNDHSMNYRSAVVHGNARLVTDQEEKLRGLRALTDHLAPGSWGYARELSAKELAAVVVLGLDLAEASVKVRAGDPTDEPDDVRDSAAWAGVLPMRTVYGEPEPSADLASGAPVPAHVRERAGQPASTRTGPLRGSGR